MKKDIEWLTERVLTKIKSAELNVKAHEGVLADDFESRAIAYKKVLKDINQLDESEVLSQKWISENVEYAYFDMLDGSGRLSSATAIIKPEKLKNLLVPKQEEVDRAYKDGYEKGKQHTFYKGYLEGLADKESESETVADVVTTFWKSFERLKEVMSMEVEELEECVKK